MKGYIKYTFKQDEIDKINFMANELSNFLNLPKSLKFGKVTKYVTTKGWFGKEKISKRLEFKCLVPEFLKDYCHVVIIDEEYHAVSASEIGVGLLDLRSLLKLDSTIYLDEELSHVVNCMKTT